jgi:hypothetical protein
VIREAIERYLAAQSEQAIDQAIVDGYTCQPPHYLGAQCAVRASITAENWDEPR